jgi:hypothetical protein
VKTNINGNDVAFHTVCHGLRGWENFNDASGKADQVQDDQAHHGCTFLHYRRPRTGPLIPEVVVSELAEEIRKANELTEAEAKN